MSQQVMRIGIVVLILGSLVGCQSPDKIRRPPGLAASMKMAARYQATGDGLIKQGREAEAMEAWQLALALNPDNPALRDRINQLMAQKKQEKIKAVTSEAEQSLGYAGQRIEQELSKAMKNYRHSRLDEAEIAWQTVLSLNPQHAEAKLGLEKIAFERYRSDPNRAFDTMIAELYRQGMAALRQESWEQAKVKLLEAEKLAPDHSQVRHFLSICNNKLLQQATMTEVQALMTEARQAQAKQQWRQAEEAYQEVMRRQPDYQAAQQSYQLFKLAKSKWLQARREMAQQAYQQQHYRRAQKQFNELLAVQPDDQTARAGLAKVKQALAKNNHQVNKVQQTERLFNRGMDHYRAGRIKTALSDWQAARSLDPDNQRIQHWLTTGQKQLGQQNEQAQQQAEALYAEGLAAYQRGEIDEALSAWREVLQRDPDHQRARDNIKRVEATLQE